MKCTASIPVLLAFVASCASTAPAPAPQVDGSAERTVEASFAESAAPVAGVARRLDAESLELWNTPNFRRWFAESYIAESEVEPGVTSVEREQLQPIFDMIAADQVDKAMAEIQKRRGPASSAVFEFTLAGLHFQQDQLDQALPLYAQAVEKYPRFRRAWRNMGLIQFREGDFTAASQSFSRVISLGGNDATTFGLLGFAYTNLDNHLSAESAYRMAVLLDPATLDWKMGLARSLFKQARFADAASLCDTLIAEQPDRADLWLLQANAYVGLGRMTDAVQNYELVDSMGAATVSSLEMLGDIYVNEELYDLAADTYGRAVAEAPAGKVDRALRAARVLNARGALEPTKRLIAAVEQHHGEHLEDKQKTDLLRLRARIAVAEGSGDEEARLLEEIVALDPLDGDALILLGQHAGRNEQVEKAIFYYERAAALEDFEADAKVRHAQLLVGERRYQEALPLLRRAQVLKPRENIQKYLEQVERIAVSR